MNKDAVEEWLQVRRELLAKEAAFTDLAIRVSGGESTEEELQGERLVLEGLREMCTGAYRRAFPEAVTSKKKPAVKRA